MRRSSVQCADLIWFVVPGNGFVCPVKKGIRLRQPLSPKLIGPKEGDGEKDLVGMALVSRRAREV